MCLECAKTAITACLFKKKCEDADNFFRHQLLIRKIQPKPDVITISEEEEDSDIGQSQQELEDSAINPDADNKFQENNLFNINTIPLLAEYMQQQQMLFAKDVNNLQTTNSSHSEQTVDDEQLPLIPEIELITPHEDVNTTPSTEDIRGYQCSICSQWFNMKQVLKLHMRTTHGASGAVYECSNCKKTYLYKRFLEKHVRRGRCVQKRKNHT